MVKGDLEILHTITTAVHESFDLQHIYDTALDLVLTLTDVDMAFVYLISADRKQAVLQAHRNLTDDYLSRASRIPYPKGITWKLLNSGQVSNIEDIQKDKDVGPAGKAMGHRRGLGIPIILEGIVMGVIWLASYKTGEFSEEEVKLNVSIGKSIGIAIAKAKLYKEMENQVRIRTAELEETNKRLRQEIEDRKRAEDKTRVIREHHEMVNSSNKLQKNMQNVNASPIEESAEKRTFHETPVHERLSNSEYRIMLMIASGNKNKDIAKENYLSASTVSTYRARILEKLNLSNNSELVRYAIRNNLID
jgi:DNA-binding CsgD family transcriptional regulator/transcriptional regulator with GAF, ATPase, and Fis domain